MSCNGASFLFFIFLFYFSYSLLCCFPSGVTLPGDRVAFFARYIIINSTTRMLLFGHLAHVIGHISHSSFFYMATILFALRVGVFGVTRNLYCSNTVVTTHTKNVLVTGFLPVLVYFLCAG